MVSVFFGPLLLAGELGSANMPNDFADKDAYLSTAPVTVPTIANSSTNPADWLQPVTGTPLAFTVHDAGSASGSPSSRSTRCTTSATPCTGPCRPRNSRGPRSYRVPIGIARSPTMMASSPTVTNTRARAVAPLK